MSKESDTEADSELKATRERLQTSFAGLDLEAEGEDEEYKEADEEEDFDESNVKEEDDLDMDEDVEDDEDELAPVKKKRGRKRKNPISDDEEKPQTAGEDGEQKETDAGHAEGEIKTETEEPPKKKGKRRGRKPKIPRPEDVFYDDKGNEINVKNDEIVLEDEDPKGCEKIDDLGFLKGDRKFRVKTFTLLGKGERQYMVSTEPARLVGFRDSYLLFKTHLTLFKKVCTNEEKMDLINRHLIPTSYKGRAVNLVTARSIYREFGARMIVGGKKVIDDFYEQKAIERGDVEGEYADPEENSAGNPDGNPYQVQTTGSALINYTLDVTWMHQVSLQTIEYNKQLNDLRNLLWLRGIRDTYTGLNFYPVSSQPTRARLRKLGDSSLLSCSIVLKHPDIKRKITGLASVPKEIFEDIDDEDLKKEIVAQQQFEKQAEIL